MQRIIIIILLVLISIFGIYKVITDIYEKDLIDKIVFTDHSKMHDYILKKEAMVETQITNRGIKDSKVLKAMLKVDRHLFVPKEQQEFAYEDYPLPIGYGQTISQPYIVAYMTEQLNLNKLDKVLEIGTGSGYQAAVLAELADVVYTIEILDELCISSEKLLSKLRYKNISVKCGDGYQGWEEHAPYDAIIVTAAPPQIPRKLVEQLKEGGRMIIPVGSFDQELVLITKTRSGIQKKSLIPVRFVPMIEK